MATFGHFAVGMLTGRLHGGGDRERARRREQPVSAATLLFFGTCALLPDADLLVDGAFGVRDLGPFGHRGVSHGLVTAVIVGLVSALLARRFGWPTLRTGIAALLATASHGFLDAFGKGGRGIPLFWPLSDARFMSPWRFLPDAPYGLGLLSKPGLREVALEALIFFPITAFALWRGRRAPEPARPPAGDRAHATTRADLARS